MTVSPRPVLALLVAALAAPPVTAAPARREMITDRPDTTDSPFTVAAGDVQAETTLFGYARGRRDGNERPQTYEFATTNLRIGLTPSLEVDLGLAPYTMVDLGAGAREHGAGAFQLRAKFNLMGNDRGSTALALLPFVTVPLDSGVGPDDVEYGVLVPVAFDLSGAFGLGLNGGIVAKRPDAGRAYRAFGIATASLSIDLSKTLGSYLEVASEFGDGPAATSFNTGLLWQARDDLQLDTGVQIGVSGDADVFASFVGVSVRF